MFVCFLQINENQIILKGSCVTATDIFISFCTYSGLWIRTSFQVKFREIKKVLHYMPYTWVNKGQTLRKLKLNNKNKDTVFSLIHCRQKSAAAGEKHNATCEDLQMILCMFNISSVLKDFVMFRVVVTERMAPTNKPKTLTLPKIWSIGWCHEFWAPSHNEVYYRNLAVNRLHQELNKNHYDHNK